MKENIVYRYISDGEIIYIGKTNSSLSDRVYCHSRERKFSPYLKKNRELNVLSCQTVLRCP